MKKWEYNIASAALTNLADLNGLGEEGWELVGFSDYSLILKRPKEDGINLVAFRKQRHLTQAAVAEYLGCTKGFISQVERGKVGLPYEKEKKLKEWEI